MIVVVRVPEGLSSPVSTLHPSERLCRCSITISPSAPSQSRPGQTLAQLLNAFGSMLSSTRHFDWTVRIRASCFHVDTGTCTPRNEPLSNAMLPRLESCEPLVGATSVRAPAHVCQMVHVKKGSRLGVTISLLFFSVQFTQPSCMVLRILGWRWQVSSL